MNLSDIVDQHTNCDRKHETFAAGEHGDTYVLVSHVREGLHDTWPPRCDALDGGQFTFLHGWEREAETDDFAEAFEIAVRERVAEIAAQRQEAQ